MVWTIYKAKTIYQIPKFQLQIFKIFHTYYLNFSNSHLYDA